MNRLIQRKGLDVLLRALSEVHKELGEVFELQVVGEGNLDAELTKLSATLGLSHLVTFQGAVPHERLPDVYRRVDAFVLTSRAEGMSNALLEAMASGLLPIVTDTGGSAELVDGNGIVIPADDPAALVNALKRVLFDADLRCRMGRESRQRAEALSWRSAAQQYLAIYRDIQQVRSKAATHRETYQ